MTLALLIAIGLAMGLVFGIALEKSRVFEPGVILGQLQLNNFVMLKVFLAATATGLIALAVMNGLDIVSLHPKGLNWQANLVGGLILGVGIALAGACPGTVLAQIGAGYRDAWFTIAGGLAGAMTYGYLEPAIKPLIAGASAGKPTLASVTGLPYWLLAAAVATVLVLALVLLERWRPWRREIGPDFDGLQPDDETRRRGVQRPVEA